MIANQANAMLETPRSPFDKSIYMEIDMPAKNHTLSEKPCSVCAVLKPISSYYIKRGNPISMCKQCAVIKAKEWADANPEKRAANWMRSQIANRDRHNAQSRAHYARNRDRSLESKRLWVERNPDKRKQAAREYVQRNLDKANALWHKRRAKLLGNGGQHTPEDVERLYQQQKGMCANLACHVSLENGYDVDHVLPVVLGGTDNADNLQLLCKFCNRRKHAKPPERWARENGLLF